MADTIRQQIVKAVQSRFESILIKNGYRTNAGNMVAQWEPVYYDIAKFPSIEFKDDEASRMEGGPIGFFRWSLKITVIVHASSDKTTLFDVREILADIYKAIGTDETWGTLAQWTEQPSDRIEIKQEERRIAGGEVIFNIIYDAPKWQQ